MDAAYMLKGRIAGSLFAALFRGDWPHEFLENDGTLEASPLLGTPKPNYQTLGFDI